MPGVPVPEVPEDGHAQGGGPTRPRAGRQAKVQGGRSSLWFLNVSLRNNKVVYSFKNCTNTARKETWITNELFP